MQVADINFFLALGTIGLNIATVILLAVYFFSHRIPNAREIQNVTGRWGMGAALLITLSVAFINCFYESLGFEPCPLCWWQRIFLYPQAVLFALALWKINEYQKAAVDFSIVLSVIGAGVALYQHALQMLPGSGLPCPATGASCSTRIIFEFGYITYPMMAFSVFAFLILVMFFVRSHRTL